MVMNTSGVVNDSHHPSNSTKQQILHKQQYQVPKGPKQQYQVSKGPTYSGSPDKTKFFKAPEGLMTVGQALVLTVLGLLLIATNITALSSGIHQPRMHPYGVPV